LQCTTAVFIIIVSIVSGSAFYLVPALVLALWVSFYSCAVTVWLTGLAPNVLIYDVKVLAAWLLGVGVVLLILIMLIFTNPFYAIVSALLFPATVWLINAGYRRWDSREQQGF